MRARKGGRRRASVRLITALPSDVIAARSPVLFRFFGTLFMRDLARSFHAVRLSGRVPDANGPLVIFANHPSWWDGALFVVLGGKLFAGRRGFVPIEAVMLRRYGFFGRLGAFGVTTGYAGAATFLRVAEAVLALDDGLLLVNAEGRFRDVRERPLRVAAGLAHVAKRVPAAQFVPLAIEYPFWDERRPNCLIRFGDPMPASAIAAAGPVILAEALAVTMDALAADAATRDPSRFETLIAGRTQINPIYDAWRRLLATMRGQRFDPAHRAVSDRAP